MRSSLPRWQTGYWAWESMSERSPTRSCPEAKRGSERRCLPRTPAMILIRRLAHLRRSAGSSALHRHVHGARRLANDLLTERHQGAPDQLEVGDRKRDPDDRDAEQDSGGNVGERKPPAGDNDPDDIAEEGE